MEIKKKSPKKRMIIIASIALVVALGGTVAALVWRGQTSQSNSGNSAPYDPTKMQSNPNVPQPSGSGSNGGITQSPDAPSSAPTPAAGTTPGVPIGTFVSSHHLSLGGNSAVESTCSTTPGATCQITFTMGGAQKTLAAKTTDSNGNVQWTWNVIDVGLTAGEWTVTAVASIGSNVVKADDAMKLEVGQ